MNILLAITLNLFLLACVGHSAIAVYEEDFSMQEGLGAVGPTPTINTTGADWTVDISGADLSAATDYLQVVGGSLDARDTDGPAIWLSPTIDISGHTSLNFSLLVTETGNLEGLTGGGTTIGQNTDYVIVEYSIDGGSFITIADWMGMGASSVTLADDFTSQSISQSIGDGSTLDIRVTLETTADAETISIDNILVTGIPEPSSTLLFSSIALLFLAKRKRP